MQINQEIKNAFNSLIIKIINNLSMKSTWLGLGHGLIAIYGFIVHDSYLISLGAAGLGAGIAYGNGIKKDV